MSEVVISVENLSKCYRLGSVTSKTFFSSISNKFKSRKSNLNSSNIPAASLIAEDEILWALNNISFQLHKGEVLGVVGRNGAGKSTLLKLLSRISSPSSGEIKIKGKMASLLEVGTGFHPELTGRENIFLNGAILGMSRKEIQNKFDEIVSFSGVEKFIDTPVKRYSSGMYVRLAFAVAAHLEPDILVIDEVLAVGDFEFQKKCLGKMNSVSKEEGRTILFVSHQMEAVQSICSRAILLKSGNLQLDASVELVVSEYLSEFIVAKNEIKLSERVDRSGSGEFKYVDVFFTDHLNNRILAGLPGKPLKIHLIISKSSVSTSITEAIASLGFHDEKGRRLFTLSNKLLMTSLKLNGDTELIYEIPKLQLYEGSYTCNVFLAHGSNQNIIDWIQHAFNLQVLPNDYFGTGEVVRNGKELFFVDHEILYNPITK